MTIVGAWVGVAVMAIGLVGLTGIVYGYRSEVMSLREELDEQRGDLTRVIGRLNQLARYVKDNVPVREPDTGPISLMDRPSPAQIASPTRPDLEAQKPPVSSGGRHRATAA